MSRNVPPALALFDAWSRIAVTSQSVIAMRLLGMAGFWNVHPQENQRMVAEKWQAVFDAGWGAWRSAALGAAPMAVALAYARPVGIATRGNLRRLKGGNPMLPQRRKRTGHN